MDKMKLQLEWEAKYNNLKEYDLLAQDFLEVAGQEFESEDDAKIASKVMTFAYLYKRIPVTVLIPMLAKGKDTQHVANIIDKAAEKDLVDLDSANRIVLKYEPEQEIVDALAQFEFPPPMLCPPNHIGKNNDSPYLTIKHDSIILNRDINDADNDYCLEVINYLNNIKFVVNTPVNNAIHNSWEGVKEQGEDESREDFNKKVKAFEKYNANANVLIDRIENNEFYLPHHYDKRGRIYSQGYYINYQGNDWNKGCVLFANEEMLDED